MSNQTQRIKHSQRLLRKRAAVRKQVKIAKSHGMETKNQHQYTKRHAMNCGVPNCSLCASPRKLWKERTVQEESFDQTRQWDQD